jgi:two-component system, OmpR family, alkaline phosphatase synthesis response regulator PhoP
VAFLDKQPFLNGFDLQKGMKKKENRMANERIFMVDDDPDFLKVCSSRLASEGYQVETFEDANEAIRSIRSKKPDLVLSDVKMPGLNGLEVCDLLRHNEQTKNTPIILITGYKDKRQYVESLNISLLFFMVKPFSSKDLLSTVRMALDSAYNFEDQIPE